MNHANLRALILSNQSSDHRLMRFNASGRNIDVRIYSGAKITSYPDGHWELTLKPRNLSGPAVDFINMITPADFIVKKQKPHVYKFGDEDYLAKEAIFHFDCKGEWAATQGSIIFGAGLVEKTKALRVLTRRVRKKVQPQLRLLGADKFPAQRNRNGYLVYIRRDEDAEINALMGVLDGVDVVKNLTTLMHVCGMHDLFGQGNKNWTTTSEFRPKAIIDKILRRVSVHKLVILEKYDDRNRKAANRPKASTRRAA